MRIFPAMAAACLLGISALPVSALAGAGTPARIDPTQINPAPLYPADAQKRGEQGSVELAVYVGSAGQATGKVTIIKSSGFPDLDNSAIEAVLGWHYVAATDANGDTRSAWTPLRIEFRPPPPPPPPATAAKAAKGG